MVLVRRRGADREEDDPVILDFEVYGEKQVSRELMRFGERAVEAEPAFHEIADRMRAAIEEQFETEGGHGSGGWAPLQPATVEKKAALGLDPRILHATGVLRETLTGEESWNVHAQGLELSTGAAPYGVFHQKGAPRANIPVRRPVDFTALERQEFVKILQEWLMGGHE